MSRRHAQAVHVLEESERRLRSIFDAMFVFVALIDLEGNILEVNLAPLEAAGLKRADVLGQSVPESFWFSHSPEMQAQVRRDLTRAALGEIVRREYSILAQGGRTIAIDTLFSPLRNDAGRVTEIVACAIDITERKEAEDAAARTTQRIRQLNRTYAVLSGINQLIVRERTFERILEGACRIAVEQGGFLLAWIGLNDTPELGLRLAAHAGATPDTVHILEGLLRTPELGCSVTAQSLATAQYTICNDIANYADAAHWREAALERGYRAMASFPLVIGGEATGTLNLYASESLFFDADEVRLLSNLSDDIAFAIEASKRERQHQRAIEQLRSSEERFRELAETIEDVFWISEPDNARIIYVSPAYERIWGRSRDSLYDDYLSWFESVHPDDRERVRQAAHARQVSGSYDEEYRIVRPDRQVRWIRDQGFPVRNAAGEIERIVGVAQDITERRQLAKQLFESQKMDAIGQLASGIAHDFNNLLGTILGNANLARMDLAAGHPALESIDEIRRAGQRASELVQRILTFGRPQDHRLAPLQLGTIVEEAVRLLRATLPAGIELTVQQAPSLPDVRADAGQIHQIVMNLVTNGWHAIGEGRGRITLELETIEPDEELRQQHPELRPEPYVRLSVTDTGCGMDSATLARIFEPFFTNKPAGRGTGLGLSVVQGIVQSHGGAIAVDTALGRGSTFHLYFPTDQSPAQTIPVAAQSPIEAHGSGQRILYVDDEEPLVYLFVRLLKRIGYQASGYSSPTAALTAFRADPSAFDLVISDMNMPELSGLDLARQIVGVRPEVKVVLVSGFLRPAEMDAARALGVREVILKPNTVDELVPIVQRLLTARGV